jgi:hypothetical protein
VEHLQAGSQVTIFDGVVPLGTALADARGVAYLALPSTPGTHHFRAVLRGTGERINPTVHATIPGSAGSALAAPVVLEPNRAEALATIFSSGASPGVVLATPGVITVAGTSRTYPGPASPASLISADLDGDGRPDLVAMDHDGTLWVLLNRGDGGFETKKSFPGSGVTALVVSDFNQDGIPDLAAISREAGSVSVLEGVGDGSFRLSTSLHTMSEPRAIAVGDWNGDGIADLAISDYATNRIAILLGNAEGGFKEAAPLLTGNGPTALVAADVDGDGLADLVVLNQAEGSVSIFAGSPRGAFQALAKVPAGPHARALAVGDLDGDGQPDLVIAGADLSIAAGAGKGAFLKPESLDFPEPVLSVLAGDWNGNGRPGLIVAGVKAVYRMDGGNRHVRAHGPDAKRFRVAAALSSAPAGTVCAAGAAACTVDDTSDTGATSLRAAVQNIANGGVITLTNSSPYQVCTQIVINKNLTILGGSHTLSACSTGPSSTAQTRLLVILGGTVSIQDLTLSHGYSRGGNGADGFAGGGGGAGMGGAVYVKNGNVTFTRVVFDSNKAVGGNGGNGNYDALDVGVCNFGYGGGGGATDGMDGSGSTGGSAGPVGGAGGDGWNGCGKTSGDEGAYGAGGGGSFDFFAGRGGYGGGGGGWYDPTLYADNSGPYGGGGAKGGIHTATCGMIGSFFQCQQGFGGGGGGGGGLGGAIFVAGGHVDLIASSFANNAAIAGSGGVTNFDGANGRAGYAFGSALFVSGSGTVNLINESKLGLNFCGSGQDFCTEVELPFGVQPVTIALTAQPNGASAGAPVTISAAVTAPAPSRYIFFALDGPVDFYDGDRFLGSAPIVNGAAQIQTRRIRAGSRTIRARYSGTQFLSASSGATNISISPVPTLVNPTNTSFGTGQAPLGIVTGDFNGDDIPDLAVAASGPILGDVGVYLHLGNGDGTFTSPTFIANHGSGAGIEAADFGFRGALSAVSDSATGIRILQGDNHGQFPSSLTMNDGINVSSLVSTDFNRDGFPDLVVLQPSSPGVGILLGDVNTGGLYPPNGGAPGLAPAGAVAVGDFDGDGFPDLAVGSSTSATPKIWIDLGNGDGTFRSPVGYTVTGAVHAIATGDFNGDGKIDLAVADDAGISILLGNGNGTFQAAIPFPLSHAAPNLAVADLNGDGKDDVVITDRVTNQVGIYLSTGNGNLTATGGGLFGLGATPMALTIGDFDRDGIPDIAVALGNTSRIAIIRSRSAFSLSLARATSSFYQSQVGAQYNVTVRTTLPYAGTVSATVTIVPAVGNFAAGGNGWTCSAAGACQITGTWAAGNLPALPVTFNVPSYGGPYSVTATMTAPANLSTGDTFAVQSASFGFTMTPNTTSLYNGQVNAQFVLTATNNTPVTLGTGLQVAYQLPAQLPVLSATGTGWSCDTAAQLCSLTTNVAGNTNYPPLTLTVSRVSDTASGNVTSSANLIYRGLPVPNGWDAVPTTVASQSVTSSILPAGIAMTVSPAQQNLFWDNPTAQFSITVQNNTAAAFTGLQLSVTLPSGLAAGSSAGGGWICTGSTCTHPGNLPPNSSFGLLTIPATYANQDQVNLNVGFNLQMQAPSALYTLSSQNASIQVSQRPNLQLSVAPLSPSFTQGQKGATFVIRVQNLGGATVGTTTLTTTPGAGLTAASISGNGWSCGTTSCTTSNAILPGVLYTLQANVNVAGNAPASVSEAVTVNGVGGSANASGTASVIQTNLVMRVSHTGTLVRGGPAAWSIGILNGGTTTFSGAISVADTLPSGATALSIAGTGWSCTLANLTCTRADALTPGFSYPPIGVTATLSFSVQGTVTNTATLSGAGPDFSATDTAALGNPTATTLLPLSPANVSFGQPVTFTARVSPIASQGNPAGSVIFLDNGNALAGGVVQLGQASYTTRLLSPGSHVLRAVYSGDSTYGSSVSNLQSFVVNVTPYSGQFARTGTAPSGHEATGMAVFDFDGDGIPDTAIPSNEDNFSITFRSGNGDGTFTQRQVVNMIAGLSSLAVADFNGDGLPDVAVAGQGGVFILLNTASHRFVFPAGTNHGQFLTGVQDGVFCGTQSLAAGDFNLDGRVDIAAVNGCGGLHILTGNGDGTIAFDTPYNTNMSSGQNSRPVIGDFNGDGTPDIAVTDVYGSMIHLLPGRPGGTFGTPVDTVTPLPAPLGASMGDFNGDGRLDLAVASYGQGPFDPSGGGVCIMLGHGEGTFQLPAGVSCLPADGTSGTVTGDFNGDGILDVAFSSQDGLGILRGKGDGTFKLVQTLPADSVPIGIFASDFNGDGIMDVAVNNRQSASLAIFTDVAPHWAIQMTRVGTPTQGQAGFQYQVLVTNSGSGDSSGMVTVTEQPGAGITVTGMSGSGWSCNPSTLTCTRQDALAAGASYPAITVTVNITAAAILNQVRVSGGATNTASAQDSGVAAANTVKLTLQSNPAGPRVQVQVGTVTYTLPAVVAVPVNAPTTISASLYTTLPANDTRYRFQGWSDGGAIQHAITPSVDTVLTVSLVTQYMVTTSIYPASGGTATGGGWYDANATATLSATPAAGYVFTQWSGISGGTPSAISLPVGGPITATANFAVSAPALSFTIASKADATTSPQRVWTLSMANKGTGTAVGVSISAAVITIQSGAGQVTLVTPLPVTVGDIPSGQAASVPITLSFPATSPATFISLKLTMTANGGAYTTSQTLSFQAR